MTDSSPSRRTWLRTALLITGVVVIAAIGAFFIWLNQDADPQAPILPTSTPRPESRVFAVDIAESELGVSVNSNIGLVEGGYEMSGGTVELDREGDDGWRVIANLSLDARTLDVGNDGMNTVLRRALNVEEFPTGTFVASSETLLTDLSQPQTLDLIGQIELHGSVQDYTIPTTIVLEDSRLSLSAQIVIDASQFGADIPSLMAEDELDADLRVVAYETDAAPEETP